VKFVCPSCAATNRVPDKCAGITIICRKCKTQVNVPGDSNQPTRSWLTSPGWVAVAAVEAAALIAVAVVAVLLARSAPPEGLPLVENATGGPPQLAAPGGTLVAEWDAKQQATGGHFRLTDQDVSLVGPSGRTQAVTVLAADKPWPDSLLESPPQAEPTPLFISLELHLPSRPQLAGQRVRLRASVVVEYPAPQPSGDALAIQRTTVLHERELVMATPEQQATFAAYLGRLTVLRWLVFLSAMVAIGVPIGAASLAQRRISIMCPKCGRGTTAVFYHEGGDYYVSPCPHRGGRLTDAEG